MTYRRTLFAVALTVSASLAIDGDRCAHGAIIRFRPSAEVAASVVQLGDIADVRDRDPNKVERLKQLTLAPAPAPGTQMRLDFSTIRARLAAQGVNLAEAEFSGASLVTVTVVKPAVNDTIQLVGATQTQLVADWQNQRAERLLAEAVAQYVRRHAPELGPVDVAVHVEPEDVPAVLAGAVSGYEIRGGGPPWEAPQVFEVRFLDRGEAVQEVRIGCRLTRQPQMLTVKHHVPAGYVLQASDLELQPTVGVGTEGGLTRPEDVVGKETKRTLRKGQPIRLPDLQAVPLVRSNDVVIVYSRRPGISVRRHFKSRSEGALGETVTLVSLDGRQSLLAQVIGYREAEVIGSSGPPAGGTGDGAERIRFFPNEELAATPGGDEEG